MNISEQLIREIVEKVVAQACAAPQPFEKHVDKNSGVLVVKTDTVKPEPFEDGGKGVYLTDIVSLDESPRLGAGVMEMDHTSFAWTLNYDEFDYIIDGTLEVIVDGVKTVGNKGDIMLIPKGSSIIFSAPEFARFVYFVYPADWATQKA